MAMKELSIEEKAKAYDEAKLRMSAAYNSNRCTIGFMNEIFPELAKSEGERIRKALIKLVKKAGEGYENVIDGVSIENAISWLEKKGEQKPVSKVKIGEKYRCCNSVRYTCFQIGKVYEVKDSFDAAMISLCSDYFVLVDDSVEQKPDDKIEPRFKVGDWVVRELDNTCYQIKKCILNVTNNKYGYDLTSGGHISSQDANFYHLWTIQDAKDGDVLSFNDGHGNDCIDLIKSITDKKIEFWFCLTNGNSYEVFDGITPYTNLASREDATPASKEQRDLLFQKIKEAGYEWDAEKKELRKIEQNPWSEEDEYCINQLIVFCENCMIPDSGAKRCADWLKSLKERYTWKPNNEHYELEEFAKIVRGNLTGISKAVQKLFEAKYLQLTGNKMYGGFKD